MAWFVFWYWEGLGLSYWSGFGMYLIGFVKQTWQPCDYVDWLNDLATYCWFSTGGWRPLWNRRVHFHLHPHSQELPTASGHLQDIWNRTVKASYTCTALQEPFQQSFRVSGFSFVFSSIALWNRYPGCDRRRGCRDFKGLLHYSG